MSLQLALLLIGIAIVAVVSLTTLNLGRLSGLFRRPPSLLSRGPNTRRIPPSMPPPALDTNPVPPAGEEQRVLRSDAPVAPAVPTVEERIRREIEMLEEVAVMPLDLDNGLRAPGERRPPRPAKPDEHIDFVLYLPDGQPVERDTALGIFKQNEYRLEKPRKLYGMDAETGQWTELAQDEPSARYHDLALSIQMVDAIGPLDESEINTFAQVGLKLADALHRVTRFSMDFDKAVEHARGLQKFCDAFDVVAAVNVAARDGVMRGRDVEGVAKMLGLHFGPFNIFHMKAPVTTPGCQHLFSMASMAQPGEFHPDKWDTLVVPGVTFFMSVPCAHRPVAAFERMIEVAQGMAAALNGQLLDQDRRPLSERGIAVILRQIEQIDEKMRAYGVPPGSESALRLFGSDPASLQVPAPAPAHV